MELLFLAFLGGAVGMLSSLLGVGGGVLIVPLLPLVVDIHSQQEVIATSLFSIFLVTLKNAYVFHKMKLIDWYVVLRIAFFTSLFSVLAVYFAKKVSSHSLQMLLAVILLIFSIITFFIAFKRQQNYQVKKQGRDKKAVLLGLTAGLLSGFTGIGSGSIMTIIMMQLKMVKDVMVTPSSNAILVFTTLFGSLSYMFPMHLKGMTVGLVHIDKAITIVIFAWLTSHWGGHWQRLLSLKTKKISLSLLLLFLALKILMTL